jgi:predicted RNA methylase
MVLRKNGASSDGEQAEFAVVSHGGEPSLHIVSAPLGAVSSISPQSGHVQLSLLSNTTRARARALDQYYTHLSIAEKLYQILQTYYCIKKFCILEPSAGEGAFYRLLPRGSVGIDLEPKFPGIIKADFLTIRVESARPVACIGNPPFGKNASMAIRFFNHAADQSQVIAFVLPKSFRKASVVRRLHRHFHLVHEQVMPEKAFLFDGEPCSVPSVFQIWERRENQRDLTRAATQHPDFEFTTPDRADFAIRRVGARAGHLHHDFSVSQSTHYFIRGGVEPIMTKIDFSSVVQNVAGTPSLAKTELVRLYEARVSGGVP